MCADTNAGSASETHGVGNGSRSHEILLLAACGPNELLPMNPDYPADLFTTCLTSPIKMALRWFISTHSLIAKSGGITPALLERIPVSSAQTHNCTIRFHIFAFCRAL